VEYVGLARADASVRLKADPGRLLVGVDGEYPRRGREPIRRIGQQHHVLAGAQGGAVIGAAAAFCMMGNCVLKVEGTYEVITAPG
jgi:hypothetical protein